MRTLIISSLIFFVLTKLSFTQEKDVIKISLKECINIAKENSPDLKILKRRLSMKINAIEKAKSVYDPYLWSNINLNRSLSPSQSTLEGVGIQDISNFSLEAGIVKQMPIGTKLELKINNLKNESNVTYTTINPFYQSNFNLNVRQSILNGFWGVNGLEDVELAKNEADAIGLNIRKTEYILAKEVSKLYCKMQCSYGKYMASKKTLVAAKELDKIQSKKFNRGEISTLERLKFSQKVLEEGCNCKSFLSEYTSDSSNLAKIMYLELNQGNTVRTIESMDICISTNTIENCQHEVSQNYEYQKIIKEINSDDIKLKIAKNAKMPVLNIVAGAGTNGLMDSYYDSYSQGVTGNYYSWYVGLEVSIKLQDIYGGNNYKNAILEKQNKETQLKKFEDNYKYNYNLVNKNLCDAQLTLEGLTQLETASNKILELETKKFKAGLSTINNVIDALDYNKSVDMKLCDALLVYNSTAIDIIYFNTLELKNTFE